MIQARAAIDEQLTRLIRFGNSLAIFVFSVGVIAGAIVPIVEFGFDVDTASGTLDAVVHMPEIMPFVVGSFLFGLAICISQLLPRRYGAAVAVGAVLMLVLGAGGADSPIGIAGATAFGLGWIALGPARHDPCPATAPGATIVHRHELRHALNRRPMP